MNQKKVIYELEQRELVFALHGVKCCVETAFYKCS